MRHTLTDRNAENKILTCRNPAVTRKFNLLRYIYANGTKMNKVENRFLKELFDIVSKGWNYLPV